MPTNLTGKVALVTGASQGIGRAIAFDLARNGATVAVAARSTDKLESLAAEITAAGGTAKPFALDVTSEDSIKSCSKAVFAAYGWPSNLTDTEILESLLAPNHERAAKQSRALSLTNPASNTGTQSRHHRSMRALRHLRSTPKFHLPKTLPKMTGGRGAR